MGDRLEVVPCTITDAKSYVLEHHRRRKPPLSGLFALACAVAGKVVGVAIVGRPTARQLQDGWTAEVTRLATDGTRNACSILYAAAWRAARALGYRRLVTYIAVDEPGTTLRAAGWRQVGSVKAESWSRRSRPRVDSAPKQRKLRWEAA